MSRIRERAASRCNDQGATVAELLIAGIALGAVAAGLIFGISTVRGRSVANACKADLRNVSVAAQSYLVDRSVAPANAAALIEAGYLKSGPAPASRITMTAGIASSTVCTL